MKKIITFAILFSGMSLVTYAQKQLPATPFQHSKKTLEMLKGARSMGRDIYVDDTDIPAPQQAPAQHTALAASQTIGYLNPVGTMFLGMDEGGKGTFFKTPGVIGGWSDSIPCWIWRNQQTGYKSITYNTTFSNKFPQYCDGENYAIDEWGNFCDTILASGGYQDAHAKDADGDAGYLWQLATPLQTTKFADGTESRFMLLNSSFAPSAEKCPLAAGGLPSGNSSDGLWPLTNAVNITRSGISMDLINYTAEDGYVHYFYGSSKYTVDSIWGRNMADTEDSVISYTRVNPVKLTTYYDKPQAPLYVKSVTLAICSDKYSAFNQSDLKLDTLYLTISDMKGNKLASSMATKANFSAMSYTKGKLLHFLFQDTTIYGEVLHEGLLIKDAFQLTITGFKEGDNFGIYAAKCIVHPTKTKMEYEEGVVADLAYEPYIMLNGIYPTLEDYYASAGLETGQVGDTIPVNMVSYNTGRYTHIATYKALGDSWDQFVFYSTFTPYDSVSRTWNMEIEAPTYVQCDADYEHNIGSDDNPITIWEYYRMFFLNIYTTSTPAIGDCIKIGKAGKFIVFRVDAINGVEGIEDVYMDSKAEKFLRNGQIFIRKNGHLYNLIGQKLSE